MPSYTDVTFSNNHLGVLTLLDLCLQARTRDEINPSFVGFQLSQRYWQKVFTDSNTFLSSSLDSPLPPPRWQSYVLLVMEELCIKWNIFNISISGEDILSLLGDLIIFQGDILRGKWEDWERI